jgi:putative toxin-antitoxin system antitoxin component (TIGR02293 family)
MSALQVAEKLGGSAVIGQAVHTDADLIAAVRKGLPAHSLELVFRDLSNLDVSQTALYRTVGNTRTLLRKRANKSLLSPEESDRLARVARIFVRAEDALGEPDKAHRWLARANRALGGERPIDLLDSDTGSISVERELGRLEHGVFS